MAFPETVNSLVPRNVLQKHLGFLDKGVPFKGSLKGSIGVP